MSASNTCPICLGDLESRPKTTGHRKEIRCRNCGFYALSLTAETVLSNNIQNSPHPDIARRALSHYIYRVQSNKEVPLLASNACDEILREPKLPSLLDQGRNLLRLIADHSPAPGVSVTVSFAIHQAAIGVASPKALIFLISQLKEKEYIAGKIPEREDESMTAKLQLTLDGWSYFEAMQRGELSGYTAFLAMQFGDEDVDRFFDSYVRPAVSDTGFELSRLDDKPRAGLIDDRLRVEIRNSKFMIADLTHGNKGAYWEAGYAEALGKPVIYSCRKQEFDQGDVIHFDTSHLHTIIWDPDDPDQSIDKLKATIQATLPEDAKH